MRRRSVIRIALGIGLALLVLLPGQVTHATPGPPYVMVNDATKQCFVGIMDDECHWCEPPAGWKVIGTGNHPGSAPQPDDCPAGYTLIDHLDVVCHGAKFKYCCGGWSTTGDCEDMVKNPAEKLCGFVDNVHACVLPQGWVSQPTDVPNGQWYCDYGMNFDRWVDGVPCLAATQTAQPSPIEKAAESPGVLPALGLVLIALGGGAIAVMRRR